VRIVPNLALVAALVALAVLAPASASGQGLTTATVAGTVTSATGQPLSGALVTLTSLGAGGTHETTTSASGAYAFGLVAPGPYEIRVEALGYRPVVARTLTLGGGERGGVPIVLAAAPPPVLTVDTLVLGGATSSRWRAGGTRFGAAEIEGVPHVFDDLTSVAALATSADAALGSQGLPGSMSLLIADGVPFYRAAHPLAPAEQLAGPLFGRSSLATVTVLEDAADVESAGAAGGYVSVSTRTGTSGGGVEVDGAWSGDPLWSSSELDISTPSLMSFQGGARATFVVTPGSSQMVVAGDVLRQETPLGPRVDDVVGASLAGIDAALIAELTAPSVERLSRYSTLARFDLQRGATSQFFVRGGMAYSHREFDGPGPLTLAQGVALPEESTDFSVAGGWTGEYRPGLVFELRGGVSGSKRSFEPEAPGRPFALLAESGSRLGVLASGAGESSRTDILVLPGLRWSVGDGTLKLGVSARATSHSLTQSTGRELFYSDGAALVAGQGLVHHKDAPEASFSTREVGAYAQYDFQLSPALSGSVGGRFDREMIPSSEPTLSTTWLQASGLRNDAYPSSFNQLGARASLTWDPSLDGSTRIFGTVTLHHGDLDPGALAQLFAEDGSATSTYFAGAGLGWPMAPLPGGATARPTLTLFGPDARAPRSSRGTVGLVRRLVGGWNVHVGAAYRRTEFLLRRRNLNRPAIAQAVDAFGRDVYGTLQQDGALVSATGADVRRFAGFNDVWALDPDGWSEYRGVTGGLEYTSGATSLYVGYTRSETTDNWIGGSVGLVDAQLSPALPGSDDWSEATSDFDAPDRVTAAATTSLSRMTISAAYQFRSGLPFTPRYRAGVDANGDGSFRNDVAYVDAALVSPLLDASPCLSDQIDAFAVRNSCRAPAVHSLDVRLRFRVGQFMGREASLVLDGFGLIESRDGVVDDALLLVDPSGTLTSASGTVAVPVIANPDFGKVRHPSSRGRMLRIGFRIG
jgi:hypothetical protein